MPRQYKKGLRSTVYERNSIETCREKIRTTQLLKRLQDNALAEKEFLTAGQIQSIKIALDKSLPNLVSQELAIEGATPFALIPDTVQDISRWEDTFTPTNGKVEH